MGFLHLTMLGQAAHMPLLPFTLTFQLKAMDLISHTGLVCILSTKFDSYSNKCEFFSLRNLHYFTVNYRIGKFILQKYFISVCLDIYCLFLMDQFQCQEFGARPA